MPPITLDIKKLMMDLNRNWAFKAQVQKVSDKKKKRGQRIGITNDDKEGEKRIEMRIGNQTYRSGPKMSDLPRDIEEEVLSRLPVTSLGEVRSTCKKWNTLTKGESFLKRHMMMCEEAQGGETKKKKQRKGIQVVMLLENRVSLMSVSLLNPSIEPIGNLNADGADISKIFHCDGLFLCITNDKDKKLLVWNPYLGQTRWIEPRNSYHRFDRYALGYDKRKKEHKVLRFVDNFDQSTKPELEIYSLNSNSWKFVVDDFSPDWTTSHGQRGLSLKGNTYWYAHEKKHPISGARKIQDLADFLICFDFETERFGPRLSLPFHAYGLDTVTLSSVREEQVAVLFQRRISPAYTLKIWISSKIEPDAVSWNSDLFLTVDMKPLIGVQFDYYAGSFFVDEEEKVAVVLQKDKGKPYPNKHITAYIIASNGYLKLVDLGQSRDFRRCPLVCSYVPSSVPIDSNLLHH